MLYIVNYNSKTGEVLAYDLESEKTNKYEYNQLNSADLLNANKTSEGFEWLQGCKYSLRVNARNSKEALTRNFVLHSLYAKDKLIGYDVLLAKGIRNNKVVWVKMRVSLERALALHKEVEFQNVKYMREIKRLVPKYGELEEIQVSLCDAPKVNNTDIERAKEAIKAFEGKSPAKVKLISDKLNRGFSSKVALSALCIVLGAGAVVGAVGHGKGTAYNVGDTKVESTYKHRNTVKPKDAFSCKIRIDNAEKAYITSDKQVVIEGLTCGRVETDKSSASLSGNDRKTINKYSKSDLAGDNSGEFEVLFNGGTYETKLKTPAFGKSTLKVHIDGVEYTVRENKVSRDGSEVYRVSIENGNKAIEKLQEDEKFGMTDAIMLMEYLEGWNEHVKMENIKAE